MHLKLRRGVCETEQRNVQIVHEQREASTQQSRSLKGEGYICINFSRMINYPAFAISGFDLTYCRTPFIISYASLCW